MIPALTTMRLHTMSVIAVESAQREDRQMKKANIALGCLTIFVSGWAFGQTRTKPFNGAFWNSLGSSTLASGVKAAYISGFTGGFLRGLADGSIRTRLATKAGNAATISPTQSKNGAALLAEDAPLLSAFVSKSFGLSNGEMVSEMDAFYRDFRNAPVCWDNALMFSIGSLEGRPPTEEQLSSARVAGAKSGSCGVGAFAAQWEQ
jgi:hypothetical protein